MTRTVSQRMDMLRDELRRLDPKAPGLKRRIDRIQRQVAMMSEDVRPEMVVPALGKRYK